MTVMAGWDRMEKKEKTERTAGPGDYYGRRIPEKEKRTAGTLKTCQNPQSSIN